MSSSSINPDKITTPSGVIFGKRLIDNIELYIWDFDYTITKVHSCNDPFFERQTLDEIIADLDLFKNTIYHLLRMGKKVAIASYGNKDLILEIMVRVFDSSNPFTENNVVTPRDISKHYGIRWSDCFQPPIVNSSDQIYNKNIMIEYLIDIHLEGERIPSANVLLLDDTNENVVNAIGAGYRAIKIPKSGYHRTLCNELSKITDKSSNQEFQEVWTSFVTQFLYSPE